MQTSFVRLKLAYTVSQRGNKLWFAFYVFYRLYELIINITLTMVFPVHRSLFRYWSVLIVSAPTKKHAVCQKYTFLFVGILFRRLQQVIAVQQLAVGRNDVARRHIDCRSSGRTASDGNSMRLSAVEGGLRSSPTGINCSVGVNDRSSVSRRTARVIRPLSITRVDVRLFLRRDGHLTSHKSPVQ